VNDLTGGAGTGCLSARFDSAGARSRTRAKRNRPDSLGARLRRCATGRANLGLGVASCERPSCLGSPKAGTSLKAATPTLAIDTLPRGVR
jgi:hypothetical protein